MFFTCRQRIPWVTFYYGVYTRILIPPRQYLAAKYRQTDLLLLYKLSKSRNLILLPTSRYCSCPQKTPHRFRLSSLSCGVATVQFAAEPLIRLFGICSAVVLAAGVTTCRYCY